MVKRPIAPVNEVGFETAKAEFMVRNGRFVDHDLYMAVVDMYGTRVVHGHNSKLVDKTYADAASAELLDTVDKVQTMAMRATVGQQADVPRPPSMRWART